MLKTRFSYALVVHVVSVIDSLDEIGSFILACPADVSKKALVSEKIMEQGDGVR